MCALKLPNAMVAATLVGQGRCLLNPPWPCSFSVLVFFPLCLPRHPVGLESIRKARCPPVFTSFLQPMSKAPPATSRGRAALDGSKAGVVPGRRTTPQRPFHPCRIPKQISDERVTTTLHTMQDYLQQTTVISQRRSQKMLSDQSSPQTRGNAAYEVMEALTQARDRQEEARRFFEQKCQDGRRGRDSVQRHHQEHL